MKELTRFQQLELILIPITFIFSQLLIFLFGISIIGEETIRIMGIPMTLGLLTAVILIFVIFQQIEIREFSQLEIIFRVLTIIGGGVLIVMISFQILLKVNSLDIIPILAFVIATIGDTMSMMCIYLLGGSLAKKIPLE